MELQLGTLFVRVMTRALREKEVGHVSYFFYQPFFFEFPKQLGKYSAGTILLVGNLFNQKESRFFSWRSSDHGKTWNIVGGWQPGGGATSGIWEPFLFLDSKDRLVAVFSDQRDWKHHAQKLVHVFSENGGDTWSAPVNNDVVSTEQIWRPGMATVARMDNGEYLMSYEWCKDDGHGGTDNSVQCPVHVKTSPDGVTWDKHYPGTVISTPDGIQPCGSPYTIWDASQKALIVSARSWRWHTELSRLTPENEGIVLINTQYGKGDWAWATSPWHPPPSSDICGANYSPNLLVLPDNNILYTTEATLPETPGIPNDKLPCELRTGSVTIGQLPYSSNFSTKGQAGWIDFNGTWSISGDQYEFAPVTEPATIAITGSSGWTDYKMSADVIITSDSGVVGLVARTSASLSAPNFLTRYTAAIDSNSGKLTVYRVTDTSTALKSASHSGGIKVKKLYHMSFSVQSNKLTAVLSEDGGASTNLSVTDDGLKSGLAGLYGHYGSGGFKNVEINSLT
ncbi:sialidase family protein [Aspergillus tanneri]|uniref:Sialidase domain-containing protein n=1 Tax=Aspergillus tanneri TaxID=1220188 RepID=A0A5M9MCC1_9EURO|nr:uncharacterized protein ATNIH1004_008756 [Aspergillus tanneri]KAA8644551.1 hypothetical protein ATNIH1004_008756 [Aspergillus tanneri]